MIGLGGLGVKMCQAAVAWEQKKLEIVEVEVYPPREGEVRIQIKAAGLCETDIHALSGSFPVRFPCILGHEGAGIVESVGPGVTSFEPGDHVIPLHIPQCGECRYCLSKKTNLCDKIRFTQEQGLMPDGTARFICNGTRVFHFMGCSTFSEYTVVSMHSLCKIDKRAPFAAVCVLGCGVSTGYGAAINTAAVEAGSSCAIFGLNAVAFAVAMGCRDRGATKIVGIDIKNHKFESGKKFGFTDFMNPMTLTPRAKITELLIRDTDAGYDYTFTCDGDINFMRRALQSCNDVGGQSLIVGIEASRENLTTAYPFQLMAGRVWKGSTFGGWKSKESVPNLVTQYLEKKLDLESFVTYQIRIYGINNAIKQVKTDKAIRFVVDNFEKCAALE